MLRDIFNDKGYIYIYIHAGLGGDKFLINVIYCFHPHPILIKKRGDDVKHVYLHSGA